MELSSSVSVPFLKSPWKSDPVVQLMLTAVVAPIVSNEINTRSLVMYEEYTAFFCGYNGV